MKSAIIYNNYEIYYDGRIFSNKTNRFLKPHFRKGEYPKIVLNYMTKKVHRLVAEVFHPNPENKCCVNHKDGNINNFHGDNLEWVTQSENVLYSSMRGRHRWSKCKGKSFKIEIRLEGENYTEDNIKTILDLLKTHGVSNIKTKRILGNG